MKRQEIKKLVKGKIFSCEFIKKDGTLRKVHCRLGVKKYLVGGSKPYNDDDFNLLTVYDLKKQSYITVNLNSLQKVKCGKEIIL